MSNKDIKIIGKEIRTKVIQKHLGVDKKRVKFIEHSFGHIAYAYCSGSNYKKNSYVASLDAFGDFTNYSMYLFKSKKNDIKFKKIVSGNNLIIARIYRYNFAAWNEAKWYEYKIMGMAPYSKINTYSPSFKNLKNMGC